MATTIPKPNFGSKPSQKPSQKPKQMEFTGDYLKVMQSVIKSIEGNFSACIVTGSAAIRVLVETVLNHHSYFRQSDVEKLRNFSKSITPHDIDILVYSDLASKHFSGLDVFPPSIGEYSRPTTAIPSKSCTYAISSSNSSLNSSSVSSIFSDDIDLIYDGNSVEYFVIGDVNFIHPKYIIEILEGFDGLASRTHKNDSLKIEICNLLVSAFNSMTPTNVIVPGKMKKASVNVPCLNKKKLFDAIPISAKRRKMFVSVSSIDSSVDSSINSSVV